MRFRSIFSWAVLLVIGGGLVYVFPNEIRATAHELYQTISPCSSSVTYTIGTIDPRFGISKTQLLSDISEATGLWSTAAKKTLFSYDQANGVVVVDLIYDSRQETTQRLKQLGISVSDDRSTYDTVKARYDTFSAQYGAQKSAFENAVTAFNAQQAEYEKAVAYWNARGGASQNEYARLQAERDALAAQSKQLQSQQDALNGMIDDVNSLATELNHLIDVLNLDVNKYNATGASTGSSFEEGVYTSSLGHESIDIYEYDNNAHLVRVLAHEFGHALGFEHVSDPKAIMYYLNQGTAITLTAADKTELKAVCRLK